MKSMPLPLLLCLLISAALADSHSQDRSRYFSIDSGYSDNLFNTPEGNTAITGGTLNATVRQQHTFLIQPFHGRRLGFGIDVQQLMPVSEYLSLGFSGQLIELWQPGRGFRAPWYEASLDAAAVWHPLSPYQNINAQLNLTRKQRLTDKINWGMGLDLNSTLYQASALNASRLQLNTSFDWAITPKWLLYQHWLLGYGQLHSTYSGSLASRAHGDWVDPALGTDYVYNPDLSAQYGGWWYTYRYQSAYAQAGLGLSHRLTNAWAVDLFYQLAVQTNDQLSYQTNQISLGLIWQGNR